MQSPPFLCIATADEKNGKKPFSSLKRIHRKKRFESTLATASSMQATEAVGFTMQDLRKSSLCATLLFSLSAVGRVFPQGDALFAGVSLNVNF
jgi:hypothetical protein